MSDAIKIGSWYFSPETGMLQKDDDTRRLENRAADLLHLLLRHKGELVSHADIIEKVWYGRFVSPNSVAVVISDIRRALGDDARKPTHIETLPKRGYRLIAATDVEPSDQETPENVTELVEEHPPSRHRRILAAFGLTAAFAAVLLVLLAGSSKSSDGLVEVYVTPVEDQTKDAQYAALVPAVSELLNVELARIDHVRIGTRDDAAVIVGGQLILWDGHPALSIHAKSAKEGHTLWSGMASGPETLLPRQVRAKMEEFAIASENDGLKSR